MSFANYLGYPLPPGGSSSGAGSTFTYLTCANETANLPNSLQLEPGAGVSFSYGLNTLTINASTASGGLGTVISVGLIAPNIFQVSGSPVTSSGNITLTFVNQPCSTVFAGPSAGANGAPSFRYLVGTDVMSALSAGTNITLTPVGSTLQISSFDSGGTVTTVGANTITGLATASVSNPTTTPSITFTLIPQPANTSLMGGISGGSSTPVFRLIQGQDLAALVPGANTTITPSGSTLIIASTNPGGTVTNVSDAGLPGSINATVGNPTTTPAISLSWVNQPINTFLGAPSSGSSGTPWFRLIQAADISPAFIPGTNISFIETATSIIVNSTNPGGTVTSVGIIVPSDIFTVTGPITSSGSITIGEQSQPANTIWAAPSGGSGTPGFRKLTGSDLAPALISGLNTTVVNNGSSIQVNAGAAGVTSVSNLDGTLTITPSTGAVVASIANNVALPGNPTAATQSPGNVSTRLATTAFVNALVAATSGTSTVSGVSSVQNLDGTLTISPTSGGVIASIPSNVALPGSPTTTTQSPGDSSTKLATTGFVTTALASVSGGSSLPTGSYGETLQYGASAQWAYSWFGTPASSVIVASNFTATLSPSDVSYQNYYINPSVILGLTLPAASSCPGKVFAFRRTDNTNGAFAYKAFTGDNIDGLTTSINVGLAGSTLSSVPPAIIQSNGINQWFTLSPPTLGLSKGGTGGSLVSAPLGGSIYVANGFLNSTAAGSIGQTLISNGTGAPAFGNINAGPGLTVIALPTGITLTNVGVLSVGNIDGSIAVSSAAGSTLLSVSPSSTVPSGASIGQSLEYGVSGNYWQYGWFGQAASSVLSGTVNFSIPASGSSTQIFAAGNNSSFISLILPPVSSCPGKVFSLKRTDQNSGSAILVDVTAGNSFEGAVTTFALPTAATITPFNNSIVIQNDGVKTWQVISPHIVQLGGGGTGAGLSPNAGGIVYSQSTSMSISPSGIPGQVVISNGTSAPAFNSIKAGPGMTVVSLSTGITVSSVGLISSGIIDGIAYYSGSTTIASTSAGNVGQELIAQGPGEPPIFADRDFAPNISANPLRQTVLWKPSTLTTTAIQIYNTALAITPNGTALNRSLAAGAVQQSMNYLSAASLNAIAGIFTSSTNLTHTGQNPNFLSTIMLPASTDISNGLFWCGLSDSNDAGGLSIQTSATGTNTAAFSYTASDPTQDFYLVTSSTSTGSTTRTDSGVPIVAGVFYTLSFSETASSVTFYINGNQILTQLTNLPVTGNAMGTVITNTSQTGAAVNIRVGPGFVSSQ